MGSADLKVGATTGAAEFFRSLFSPAHTALKGGATFKLGQHRVRDLHGARVCSGNRQAKRLGELLPLVDASTCPVLGRRARQDAPDRYPAYDSCYPRPFD